MNGAPQRAFFSCRAFQRTSLSKLSLWSNYSSGFSLFCSPLKSGHSWHTFFNFLLNHSRRTVFAKWLKFLRGPPEASAQQKLLSAPSPRLETNAVHSRISPHQGRTQRNPPTSPPSITTLFFQAVTTYKAFPQAEYMDQVNCRSLTTLSCQNSLNCLCLNPPRPHLLLLPLQPNPHSCFPTWIVLISNRTSEHKPERVGQSTVCLNKSTFWYTIRS